MSFEPPAATVGAAKPERAPKTTKQATPKDVPLDMFAPPDAQGEGELKFDLEPEEIERAARKRASTPPPSEPVPVVADSGPVSDRRYSRPSLQAPNAAAEAATSTRGASPLANPNVRWVLGVAIAVLLGFVPAHLVASARERSAFESVDKKVIATQKEADTPETYASLDGFRSDQLARKHDDRRSIAIMAMLIWAAAGGAIGYVWFRRIPWDRFDAPSS